MMMTAQQHKSIAIFDMTADKNTEQTLYALLLSHEPVWTFPLIKFN